MEIRIKDYILRPDNGSTWSLTKVNTRKEGEKEGEEYEWATIYPKNLKKCLLRVREDLIREDKIVCNSIDSAISSLDNIDIRLMDYIDKVVISDKFIAKKETNDILELDI